MGVIQMNTIKRKEQLIKELKNKEYRDAFVTAYIDTGIPFQVRALREHSGFTQKALAERTGMKQERISAIENPNYKNAFTLSTLKRLASAFDIALIVRFAPISQLVDWELKLRPESLQAVSFNEDPYFKETPQKENDTAYFQPETRNFTRIGSGGVCVGVEGIVKFINPSQKEITYLPDVRKAKLIKQSQEKTESQLSKYMTG